MRSNPAGGGGPDVPAPVDPDTVPRRRLETRVRNYRGRFFIATRHGTYELDQTAEFVFRRADGSRTAARIGAEMAAEYGLALPEAVAASAEVLTRLSEYDAVEVPGAARHA
jgi:hypothetical protein